MALIAIGLVFVGALTLYLSIVLTYLFTIVGAIIIVFLLQKDLLKKKT
jgi:hypothetical protein